MAEQGARAGGERVPEAPLVAIGAILLAAAVVGGAVEGAGVKVPVISGTGRQVVAGLLGALLLVVGLTSRWLPLARGGVGAVRGWAEVRVARRVPHPDVGVAPKASEHFIGREAELAWLRRELVKSRRVVLETRPTNRLQRALAEARVGREQPPCRRDAGRHPGLKKGL